MFRKTFLCLLSGLFIFLLLNGGESRPQAQLLSTGASSQPSPTPSPEATPTPEPSESPTPPPAPTPRPTPGFQQHSYFDATAKWPEPSIYVCWENPSERYTEQMALVRKSVAESWEAASAVRFTGWQRCEPINMGIRIVIDDSGPHTLGLGVNLDGVVNGMSLNFTFNNWSPRCKDFLNACIKSIAVHEFGHALGFAHEHNRPDTPGECDKPKQGSDGTLLLTPYDPESVMNYCNPEYNNHGVLSKWDTVAVQRIYGRPLSNLR